MLNGQAEPSSHQGVLESPGLARGAPADKEGFGTDWRGVLDVHRCHICGFTAGDVRGLGVHLSSVHPTTVYPRPVTHARNDGHGQRQEEEAKKQLSALLERKNTKNNGGPDAAVEDFSESDQSRNSSEVTPPSDVTKGQKGEETALGSATSSTSQRRRTTTTTTPPSPSAKRLSDGDGDDKLLLASCPGTPVAATDTLNRSHLVCLPEVRERLCLAWQRSEPAHELDSRSALVAAFNAFPYPTAQETGALARRCDLPLDRVKAWFMMQRVRYGISWAEEDIRDTRHKLNLLQHPGAEAKEAGTRESASGPLDEAMVDETMVDIDDDDDDNEEEEMMRAFGASEGMIEGKDEEEDEGQDEEHFFPAALWSAPPLSSSQLENSNDSLQGNFPEFPPIHSLPPGELSGGILPTNLPPGPYPLSSTLGRVRAKKSRHQLMILRRSFVLSNWPSEAELQRLQSVTALSRHEIRKWFADSRYQLRRSGSEAKSHHKTSYVGAQAPVAFSGPAGGGGGEGDGGGEEEPEVVVKLESYDTETPVSRTKAVEKAEDRASLNGHLAASSVTPSFSSSSSSTSHQSNLPADPQPDPSSASGTPRTKKKTREQTEVLRQHFLHCQWPTAEDYSVLEQRTGLPRTQIIHWFGDTRYSFKHSRLRWISPEERQDIAKRLAKEAHQRAWLVRRQKQWPNLPWERPRPQPSPGNLMDASNSSNSSSGQTLDGGGGGDFDKWYEMWDGSVQGHGRGAGASGL